MVYSLGDIMDLDLVVSNQETLYVSIYKSRFKIYLFGKQRPPAQNTSHSISTKIQVVVRSLLSYLAVIISHHTPCYKSSREPKQHICTSKKVLSRL